MDLIILSLIIAAAIYYLFLLLNLRRAASKNPPYPPGNKGLPFIGETLEFLSTSKNGVPGKFFSDRRQKYSPKVFKTSLVGESMAILCGAEGNKFLFSNENKVVKSWWPKTVDMIFSNSDHTTTGEEADRLRKVITPFLKPDSLQKYVGIMDLSTKKHFQKYWILDEIKSYKLVRKFVFELACKIFLNLDDYDLIEKLEKPINQIGMGFISLPINIPGTKLNRAIKAAKEIRVEIEKMVRQRKIDYSEKGISPTFDVLSLLLQETYENGEFMVESDIANKLFGLLTGSYDNVSTTLVSIIKLLAEMPEIYDRVLKEQTEILKSKVADEPLNWDDLRKMKYSWNFACEVLRVLPPTPGTFREVIHDFTYGGYLIPKGWKLHWNAYSTHHDAAYFREPEKFDPTRFEDNKQVPFSYVPFGGGPKMCPGREYARLNILVFIHNIVTKFKWEKVYPDEQLISDPILVPPHGLPIKLYPHKA